MDIAADTTTARLAQGKTLRGGVDMPGEDKNFSSEVKRLDSEILNIKKSHEKFETRIEKAVDDLRQETRTGFARVDARIAKLDSRLWWLMGAVIVSILMPVALKFLFPCARVVNMTGSVIAVHISRGMIVARASSCKPHLAYPFSLKKIR